MVSHTERLLEAVRAAAPAVTGLSVGQVGASSTVQVEPAYAQAQAQATINAFDWSQAAHDAWVADQKPERKALRQQAAQAIADNEAYLAVASPSNAQVVAHVRRLTEQNNRIIKRLVQVD
jgi:hypothetical protein